MGITHKGITETPVKALGASHASKRACARMAKAGVFHSVQYHGMRVEVFD